jgi:hypothetical protein
LQIPCSIASRRQKNSSTRLLQASQLSTALHNPSADTFGVQSKSNHLLQAAKQCFSADAKAAPAVQGDWDMQFCSLVKKCCLEHRKHSAMAL